MSTKLLWPSVQTPDGITLPGPHCTSSGGEIYPGLSSTVSFVISGGEVLMIDAGFRTVPEHPSGVLDRICEILDRPGLTLKYLVQTHWHLDHVGNSQYVKERYGAEVVCHRIERPAVEDPFIACRPEYLESFGGDLAAIAADLDADGPDALLTPTELVRDHWNFPVEVDREVEDGDVLAVGDLELRVLHTPGHSPGHISLYNPSSRSLYLGDVWFFPAPCHPWPAGNARDLVASIERCLELDAEYLFPGHTLPRSGVQDTRDYLLDLLIKQRQLQRGIVTALARFGPLALPDVHAEALPIKNRFNFSHDGWYTYSLSAVHAHLRWLLEQQRVERIVDDGGAVRWALAAGARPDPEETQAAGGYERDRQLVAELYARPRP
jgi:glyoxylase-like metal-dependent hydrolase (beta-lactamase superfamily II)